MMWFLFFIMYFFYTLKDFFFISNFFFAESLGVFLTSITFLTLMIILYFSFNYFGETDFFNYFSMFILLILIVSLSFLINSSFYFLVLLELCVYPMSFLIINFAKDVDKFISVLFMFGINILGSISFMVFSSEIFNTFYTEYLNTLEHMVAPLYSSFLFFCFVFILISKLPLIFLHFWLSKAHVSASGSCSMILASLMLKLGSFGLFKFGVMFLYCSFIFISSTLAFSLFGCAAFCLVMLRFLDLKYLIACSSILHMSLILPLVSCFSSEGVLGSMFMMTGHGLVSYYLFYLVSLFYEFSYNRSSDFNKNFESFSKNLAMYFFFFIFLNIGFPPFMNFFSELLFCSSLYSYSLTSVFIFCVSMLISIMFSMFLVTKMTFGKKFIFYKTGPESNLNFFSFNFVFCVLTLPYLV